MEGLIDEGRDMIGSIARGHPLLKRTTSKQPVADWVAARDRRPAVARAPDP